MHFHISGMHASTDVMNIQNCNYRFREKMILYLCTVILVLLVKSTLSKYTDQGYAVRVHEKYCFRLALIHLNDFNILYIGIRN